MLKETCWFRLGVIFCALNVHKKMNVDYYTRNLVCSIKFYKICKIFLTNIHITLIINNGYDSVH